MQMSSLKVMACKYFILSLNYLAALAASSLIRDTGADWTRAFTERDGKAFHWKMDAMGTWQVCRTHQSPGAYTDRRRAQLEMNDPARGTTVVAYERLKNPLGCPEALVVEDSGLLMLDRVVSTWVLFEKEKHRYSTPHGSPSSSLVKSS